MQRGRCCNPRSWLCRRHITSRYRRGRPTRRTTAAACIRTSTVNRLQASDSRRILRPGTLAGPLLRHQKGNQIDELIDGHLLDEAVRHRALRLCRLFFDVGFGDGMLLPLSVAERQRGFRFSDADSAQYAPVPKKDGNRLVACGDGAAWFEDGFDDMHPRKTIANSGKFGTDPFPLVADAMAFA